MKNKMIGMLMSAVLLTGLMAATASAQVEQDEFLDPMTLDIPDALNMVNIPYDQDKVPSRNKEEATAENNEADALAIQGFRVQLISSQDVSQAEAVEMKAIELFGDDVYLVFEYPNYKVRVGNFIDIKEAGTTESKARRNGFPRAWTVPSEIRTENLNQKY